MEKRDKIKSTVMYYAAYIMLGMFSAVVGPTLAGLAEQVDAPLKALGILFVTREVGHTSMAFLGGRLYDRLPGHWIFASGVLLGCIVLAFIPFLSTLLMLEIAFGLLGFCFGAMDVGGNMLLILTHGDDVAPFINGLHFFFGLGAALSPVVAAQVMLHTGGIQWTYWILAVLVLPLPFFLYLQPSPKHHSQAGEAVNGGRVSLALVLTFAVFLVLYVGGEVSFSGWISSYMILQGASAQMAAYLASGFWGAFTVARLFGIPVAMRFPITQILYVCLTAGVIFLLLMMVFPGSLAIVWLGTCGFGFSVGPVFATFMALTGKSMRLSGKILGWIMIGGSIGAMVIPWFTGQMIGWMGGHGFFYSVIGAMSLLLVVLTIILRLRPNDVITPEVVSTEQPSLPIG